MLCRRSVGLHALEDAECFHSCPGHHVQWRLPAHVSYSSLLYLYKLFPLVCTFQILNINTIKPDPPTKSIPHQMSVDLAWPMCAATYTLFLPGHYS
jgi:hypothetical protein